MSQRSQRSSICPQEFHSDESIDDGGERFIPIDRFSLERSLQSSSTILSRFLFRFRFFFFPSLPPPLLRFASFLSFFPTIFDRHKRNHKFKIHSYVYALFLFFLLSQRSFINGNLYNFFFIYCTVFSFYASSCKFHLLLSRNEHIALKKLVMLNVLFFLPSSSNSGHFEHDIYFLFLPKDPT